MIQLYVELILEGMDEADWDAGRGSADPTRREGLWLLSSSPSGYGNGEELREFSEVESVGLGNGLAVASGEVVLVPE